MIGKVAGRVDYIADDHVLIETDAGVAYEVHCPAPLLQRMPAPGERATLYTELTVREDLMQLHGFETRIEREWHRLLVSVQGVGAKASLGILGALGAAGVARALAVGDAAAVRAAPGVGPKLATRIVTELKGKAPGVSVLASGGPEATALHKGKAGAADAVSPASEARPDEAAIAAEAEAVSALVNLGCDRSAAVAAVASAGADAGTGESEVRELIRKALRQLGRTP